MHTPRVGPVAAARISPGAAVPKRSNHLECPEVLVRLVVVLWGAKGSRPLRCAMSQWEPAHTGAIGFPRGIFQVLFAVFQILLQNGSGIRKMGLLTNTLR